MSLSYGGELSERVIGSAMDVHRQLGPGLLEAVYEECLCFELKQARIEYHRQVPLPVSYKGVQLECGYRMDIVVEHQLVVEIKACRGLVDEHLAQLLGYLRASRIEHGLLINFGSQKLQIKKYILSRTY